MELGSGMERERERQTAKDDALKDKRQLQKMDARREER